MDKVKILMNDVKRALEMYPEARGSDAMILSLIWYEQLSDAEKKQFLPFLDKLSKGELINPESIRRTRQLLQKKFPSLRGENYSARQEQQTEVITQIQQS